MLNSCRTDLGQSRATRCRRICTATPERRRVPTMLTIFGPSGTGYCDRVSRRGVLRIGTFAMGGAALSLADLYRAEAATRSRTRPGSKASAGRLGHKALINVFLAGGPPHQDTFDLKPDAPSEVRGEFKPIATNVPG